MKIPEFVKKLSKYNQEAKIYVADSSMNQEPVEIVDFDIYIDPSFGDLRIVIKTKFSPIK